MTKQEEQLENMRLMINVIATIFTVLGFLGMVKILLDDEFLTPHLTSAVIVSSIILSGGLTILLFNQNFEND